MMKLPRIRPGTFQCAHPDHHGQHREQQEAFEACLVKLARMTRQRTAVGKHHRPGDAGVRRPAPQFAVDEVGEPPEENSPIGPTAVVMSPRREDRKLVSPGQNNITAATQPREAAMERHAALPQFEDFGRMLDEEGEGCRNST